MEKVSKKYIFFIILLSFLILVAIFLIVYLLGGIKENSENFRNQKKSFVETEAKARNLKRFQGCFQKYYPSIEKTENLFVEPETPIDFIEFLEEKGSNSHLSFEISSMDFQKPLKGSEPFIKFQLLLAGAFPDFLKFLEKIEASHYPLEVQSISVNKLSPKEKQVFLEDINAALSIKLYTKNKEF
ncbi:MAG: hypothetical protein U9P88_01095 [Patescibacteria group bacterium]|nr:hypothetical protein [Patescibacteria group bacterium]